MSLVAQRGRGAAEEGRVAAEAAPQRCKGITCVVLPKL